MEAKASSKTVQPIENKNLAFTIKFWARHPLNSYQMELTKGNDMHDNKLRIGQPTHKPANQIQCEAWQVDEQMPVKIKHAPPRPRRPFRAGIYYLHLCATETG